MRRMLFGDTSGWAALADLTDEHNEFARLTYRDALRRRGMLTTSLVLSELVALLTSRKILSQPKAVAYIDSIRRRDGVDVIHIDPASDAEGWQLLRDRPDKEWSHVDATSFVVMRRRGLYEAFTADHHFEQAGFVRLLK